jgi:hypothetical protein
MSGPDSSAGPNEIADHRESSTVGPQYPANCGAGRYSLADFAQRVVVTVGVTVGVIIVEVVQWFAADLFLLTFVSILLAILLRGLSDRLGTYVPLSQGWHSPWWSSS